MISAMVTVHKVHSTFYKNGWVAYTDPLCWDGVDFISVKHGLLCLDFLHGFFSHLEHRSHGLDAQ